MKKPLKRARQPVKIAAEKSAPVEKNATQKSVQKPNPKTRVKSASKPVSTGARSTPAASSPGLSAKKAATAKSASKAPIMRAAVKEPAATAKPKPKNSAREKTAALRATKKRAPKDLAVQYGEGVTAQRAAVAQTRPRKRRNAATRAKLQAVIAPDDGLLLRLARAGAISSSHVTENSNGVVDTSFRAPAKRRPRKWETLCGKCGASAQYSSSAALCIKCGTILVRD